MTENNHWLVEASIGEALGQGRPELTLVEKAEWDALPFWLVQMVNELVGFKSLITDVAAYRRAVMREVIEVRSVDYADRTSSERGTLYLITLKTGASLLVGTCDIPAFAVNRQMAPPVVLVNRGAIALWEDPKLAQRILHRVVNISVEYSDLQAEILRLEEQQDGLTGTAYLMVGRTIQENKKRCRDLRSQVFQYPRMPVLQLCAARAA